MILWWFFGMQLAALLVVLLLVRLGMWIFRRQPVRFWRRSAYVLLVAIPIVVLLTTPAILGYLGTSMVQTRGDERKYAGPRLAPDGTWQLQDRASLKLEPTDPQPGEVRIEATELVVEQGTLRAFHVPPTGDARFTAVMVHGLFRGALELEIVGDMFRRLGGDVWLVEMRNHGRSYRAPATFGFEESRDIVDAVSLIRAKPEQQDRPLVMFGVSLGTAAVALAAAQIDDLSGIVLDAPMDDLRANRQPHVERTHAAVEVGFSRLVHPTADAIDRVLVGLLHGRRASHRVFGRIAC